MAVDHRNLPGRLLQGVILAVVGLPLGAIGGFLIGGIVGTVLALLSGTDRLGYILSDAGVWVGSGLAVVVAVVVTATGIETDGAQLARAKALKEAEDRRQREAAEAAPGIALASLNGIAERAVALFESLPRVLGSAQISCQQAASMFEERSYVPFWEEVENCLEQLNNYSATLARLDRCARDYIDSSGQDVLKSINVPQFPISVEHSQAASAASAVNYRLGKIVQNAHRDFRFASIYEQRRNTAATIQGFTALDSTIQRVVGALTMSVQVLGAEVLNSNHRLGATVARLGETSENAITRSSLAEQELTRSLIRRTEDSVRELQMIRRDKTGQ